jgi:hypothetical protein
MDLDKDGEDFRRDEREAGDVWGIKDVEGASAK